MESPRGEARECPAGAGGLLLRLWLRGWGATVQSPNGLEPPQPEWHLPPGTCCGRERGATGAPWAWTPARPCLGSSLHNSFFLLAPPIPRCSVPSHRAEKGPEGIVSAELTMEKSNSFYDKENKDTSIHPTWVIQMSNNSIVYVEAQSNSVIGGDCINE